MLCLTKMYSVLLRDSSDVNGTLDMHNTIIIIKGALANYLGLIYKKKSAICLDLNQMPSSLLSKKCNNI